jgi:hypothetical protein
VFEALHLEDLDRLGEQGRLDWSRASVDTMSVRAKRGGSHCANPVDRGKPGSKLQVVLDDIPPIRAPSGRRHTRPGKVHADKAYDSGANRAYLRRREVWPRIARRGVESSARLGATGGGSSRRCRG